MGPIRKGHEGTEADHGRLHGGGKRFVIFFFAGNNIIFQTIFNLFKFLILYKFDNTFYVFFGNKSSLHAPEINSFCC